MTDSGCLFVSTDGYRLRCVNDEPSHVHDAPVGSLRRLRREDGQIVWVTVPPRVCGNGHELGPRRVLVSSSAAGGVTWTCTDCGHVTRAAG